MTTNAQSSEIKRTVRKLCLIVLAMAAFAWALVPLYDLFCEITGLNGKTGGPLYLRSSDNLAGYIAAGQGEFHHQYQPGHGVGFLVGKRWCTCSPR